MSNADTVVVLDFETTGLSPGAGDRAIEIGAVRIEEGTVTARFQELMNPGQRISGFIESYTGITNAMLARARPCSEVMGDFADFIGDFNLVAHNAGFDKRFLDSEFARISKSYSGQFACSMLAARRIFQDAPNHQLGTLVRHMRIPVEGSFHRALYDSEMTAKLWLAMVENIKQRSAQSAIEFRLIQKLARIPKHSVVRFLEQS
ncbi:MAG: 3'-5' exonuclease [Pseudomonadales bacterium]|nr:3'-5' exonuclease [Halioglobus sp.]MCP5128899.1 3'-5' exonuclease [Pseudomonadales bacterium]